MNKVILAGLCVAVACVLVESTHRPPNACDGKELGDECSLGDDVEGTCVEWYNCEGEPGCGLICKVRANSRSTRACCHLCWWGCGCCHDADYTP